jgi:alpha-tubulin suppressor-like RCC1 family protein
LGDGQNNANDKQMRITVGQLVALVALLAIGAGAAAFFLLSSPTRGHRREGATADLVDLSSAGATGISSGGKITCALLSNHRVGCWGGNGSGELGDGVSSHGHADTEGFDLSPTPVQVKGITTATQVSAGEETTCAVLSNHTIECWGANSAGELGNGASENATVYSSTSVQVGGVSNAVSVSVGSTHGCAVLSDQTVECWGDNNVGELGDGSAGGYKSTSVQVEGITTATQVSAGFGHTCALLSGGTVECWGANDGGQLGNGSTERGSPSPVPVEGITDATQVSAGKDNTCALLSNHTIECWGANNFGQLGNGSADLGYRSTPVQVKGITIAVRISVGDDHACALLSGGAVECWGDNDFDQLGDPEIGHAVNSHSSTPVRVKELINAQELSAGGDHTCALLSNHTVRCWGDNYFGELGNAKTTNSSTPVQVVGLR